MRTLLTLWAAPLVLFWGWYVLSVNDINFGFVLLTRDVNTLVFDLYGQMLGIDPASIPRLVARACVFDTLLLSAIIAYRHRRPIGVWIRSLLHPAATGAGPVPPAE